MKFSASRETLLKPLQAIIGVVERRQTMPILANVLVVARAEQVHVTATDLEVELVASADVDIASEGEITIPGRKLLDICRALPEGVNVSVALKGERVQIQAGRSRFSLSTLPAAEFPTIEDIQATQSFSLPGEALDRLLEKTHFAMAQQDVRYYLNGLLLETGEHYLRAVATDGHRLALCEVDVPEEELPGQQVIVPRKGVIELQRLLDGSVEVAIEIGSNHIRVRVEGIRFTSKLIDGRFPEYDRVIPKSPPNVLTADRESLRHALQRAAILSNEKYRGIRLDIKDSGVVIQAHNPEQEEAEEELEVEYSGEDIEIGFNVNYLLDALSAVESESVKVGLTDSNSSCLVTDLDRDDSKFVVMPMRL
ncbi:MAG: DNA polymerase III subunit beta [Gammaproteobacteria bacterium]